MPLSYSLRASLRRGRALAEKSLGDFASGGCSDLDFAEAHQREVAERRNETALDQLHAISPGEPLRVARPGKIGGAEAEPGHDRLQALLDEAAHAAVGADACQNDQLAAGTHHAGEL